MNTTCLVRWLGVMLGSVSIIGYAEKLPIPASGNAVNTSLCAHPAGGVTSARTMNRPVITATQQAMIAADDSATLDWLGNSLSLSSDGNTVLVGANFDKSNGNDYFGEGAVYVFSRNGTSWNQQAKL